MHYECKSSYTNPCEVFSFNSSGSQLRYKIKQLKIFSLCTCRSLIPVLTLTLRRSLLIQLLEADRLQGELWVNLCRSDSSILPPPAKLSWRIPKDVRGMERGEGLTLSCLKTPKVEDWWFTKSSELHRFVNHSLHKRNVNEEELWETGISRIDETNVELDLKIKCRKLHNAWI